jgi:hypothetical protein
METGRSGSAYFICERFNKTLLDEFYRVLHSTRRSRSSRNGTSFKKEIRELRGRYFINREIGELGRRFIQQRDHPPRTSITRARNQRTRRPTGSASASNKTLLKDFIPSCFANESTRRSRT